VKTGLLFGIIIVTGHGMHGRHETFDDLKVIVQEPNGSNSRQKTTTEKAKQPEQPKKTTKQNSSNFSTNISQADRA
jgi:hypothetical protein